MINLDFFFKGLIINIIDWVRHYIELNAYENSFIFCFYSLN